MINVLHICKDSEFGGIQKVAYQYANYEYPQYNGYLLFLKKGSLFNYFIRTSNIYEFDTNSIIKQILEFRKILRKRQISVIHNHSGGLFWDAISLMFGGNSLVVSHNHGCRIENYIFKTDKFIIRYLKRYFAFIINKRLIKISVSENVFRLQKIYEYTQDNRHSIIYNPIDKIQSKSDYLERENNTLFFVIGYLARLSENKGILKFLQITNELILKGLNIKIFIGGNGQLNQYVKNIVSQSQHSKFYTFYGDYVYNYDFLSQIDLLVYPSRFESFGMTITESLYLGIPVIVSKNIRLSEIVDSLVTKVDFDDLEKSIKGIIEIFENKKHVKSQLLQNRNIIEDNCNLDLIMKKLFSIYSKEYIF